MNISIAIRYRDWIRFTTLNWNYLLLQREDPTDILTQNMHTDCTVQADKVKIMRTSKKYIYVNNFGFDNSLKNQAVDFDFLK